jgi:hypothetical protein
MNPRDSSDAASTISASNAVDSARVGDSGFLAQHRLADLHAGADERAVGGVAGGDQNRVDGRVVDQGMGVCGGSRATRAAVDPALPGAGQRAAPQGLLATVLVQLT